jgi:protein O-GlcNAc transferase
MYHAGGVTTIDALRVGVPVIALAGEAHSARTGASILAAIGLDEAITHSLDAYEQLAYALATDKAALAALAAKLARNRDSAPLFDPSRLARHLELAYRMMWERHAASRGPETIRVPHLPA